MNRKIQDGRQKKEEILKCENFSFELAHQYKYDSHNEKSVTEHIRNLLKLRKYSTFKKIVGTSTFFER